MYMSQLTETYNDWGEWSDNSLHIMGMDKNDNVRFGTALFNGLPQPWVRGVRPITGLTNNNRLSGMVTWIGALLGFSGSAAVIGDVNFNVDIGLLADDPNSRHDLNFTDLSFVNRYNNDDPWFPERNLEYQVGINPDSNIFWYVPSSPLDEEGLIRGSFLGEQHEAMGGTLKRSDLVGAFGGIRE